jgi:hypothetical protein
LRGRENSIALKRDHEFLIQPEAEVFHRLPLLNSVDFMIRYSSYGSTNSRRARKQISLDRLEVEYRNVQDLRERVRKAEVAAALRKRPIPDPKHRR